MFIFFKTTVPGYFYVRFFFLLLLCGQSIHLSFLVLSHETQDSSLVGSRRGGAKVRGYPWLPSAGVAQEVVATGFPGSPSV